MKNITNHLKAVKYKKEKFENKKSTKIKYFLILYSNIWYMFRILQTEHSVFYFLNDRPIFPDFTNYVYSFIKAVFATFQKFGYLVKN